MPRKKKKKVSRSTKVIEDKSKVSSSKATTKHKKVPLKQREKVYQFKVELLDIEPLIWRQIEVPEGYSFWDLHVAIQDAMGWFDYHLHEFALEGRDGELLRIGMPDEYEEDIIVDSECYIADYFQGVGASALYSYDFGDDWRHKVILEGINTRKVGAKYPRCLSGERACPPEDCGGSIGYYDLLKKLKFSPRSDEYKDITSWLKNHVTNYHPYKPNSFNSNKVYFWDPKERWEMAFR